MSSSEDGEAFAQTSFIKSNDSQCKTVQKRYFFNERAGSEDNSISNLKSIFGGKYQKNLCLIDDIKITNEENLPKKVIYHRNFVDGESLFDLLQKHKDNNYNNWISQDKQAIIAYGLLKSIQILHSKKAKHYNLKPTNILLDKDFYPLLCDPITENIFFYNLNKENSIIYEHIYRSKDIYMRKKYRNASEIYSVGLLLYSIFTGYFPYDHYEDEDTLEHFMDDDFPIDESKIPEKLKELIIPCLAFHPDFRPRINYLVFLFEEIITPTFTISSSFSNYVINLDEIKEIATNLETYERVFSYLINNSMEFQAFHYSAINYINNTDNVNAKCDYAYFLCQNKYVKDKDIEGMCLLNDEFDNYHPSALRYIGSCFYYAYTVEKDLEKAFEFYKKAENWESEFKSSAEECYGNDKVFNSVCDCYQIQKHQIQMNIGYCYELGIGVQKDVEMALNYYKMSADAGNFYGLFSLGYFCWKNNDISKSIEYFRMSASKNYFSAYLYLAWVLEMRQEKIEEVMSCYKFCADRNINLAQCRLGLIYKVNNANKALYYLELSSNQNYGNSTKALGDLYFREKEIMKKDIEKAIYYYKLAYKQGCEEAYISLSHLYQFSKHYRDYEKAIRYLRLYGRKKDPALIIPDLRSLQENIGE